MHYDEYYCSSSPSGLQKASSVSYDHFIMYSNEDHNVKSYNDDDYRHRVACRRPPVWVFSHNDDIYNDHDYRHLMITKTSFLFSFQCELSWWLSYLTMQIHYDHTKDNYIDGIIAQASGPNGCRSPAPRSATTPGLNLIIIIIINPHLTIKI